jgi:hypothetical protein
MELSRRLMTLPLASAAVLAGFAGVAIADAPTLGAYGGFGTAPQVVTYTGAVQSLVVPAGVDQVSISATGGDGGGDEQWPNEIEAVGTARWSAGQSRSPPGSGCSSVSAARANRAERRAQIPAVAGAVSALEEHRNEKLR